MSSRIVKPDGAYIEREVHPFKDSKSQNKGKIKYKRGWWRVHRKGAAAEWELQEPLGGEYQVYVLRLEGRLWEKEKAFRERNPEFVEGSPLVYVGSTGKSVEDRLMTHLTGGLGFNKYVKKYFKQKMPREYEHLPVYRDRKRAIRLEGKTADKLRANGWGVWEGKVEDLEIDTKSKGTGGL